LGPEAEGGKCAGFVFGFGSFCARKGLAAPGSRALSGSVIESVRVVRVHGVQPAGEFPAILTKWIVL
ncbi:MAG: hypothetical protein ACRECN_09290, partial [Methylocella sp.]